MTVREIDGLFEELARLKVVVKLADGQLRISAAKGVLTEDLRRRIADNKVELVRMLEGSEPQARVTRLAAGHADSEPFPMSDLQLGFYVANDPHMEFHVRPHCYMEFDRPDLDLAAYEQAWNIALQRHRRELCLVAADGLLRTIEELPRLHIAVHDLRDLDPVDTDAELGRLRASMERSELPLETWPWFDLRVSLRRGPDGDISRIHYNHNNYFIDGYGTSVLLTEIEAYYRAPGTVPPPLQLSYRDAVLGLDALSSSSEGQSARDYWFARLPDLPGPPNLPVRAGANRRTRSRLQRRDGHLTAAAWSQFKARAAAHGVTPSNAILCAYAHVLSNWSNSDHFILSQMATRRLPELHPDLLGMLGNFVSLYPLEIRLSPTRPFVLNAREIQAQVLRDTRYLQLGGMRVLQELNRLKGSFGSAPSPYVVGSGLFLKRIRAADYTVLETCQTLLDHQFFELDDGRLHWVWDVIEECFPVGMIDAMWEAYTALLVRLAHAEDAWLSPQPALYATGELDERRNRNALALRPLAADCLHGGLARHATMRPNSTVLRQEGRALDYAGLDRRSAAIAARLVDAGVRRGDRIAVAMARSDALLCAVHGALRAGAAYVPIDPALPAERIALLLGDTGAEVVLADCDPMEAAAWSAGVRVLNEDTCVAATSAPDDVARPDDLAYVIYTSGSTGRPKGVMIDHRGAHNTIADINNRFGVNESDVVFGVSAFNFDLSVYDLFGTIAAGGRLVFPDRGRELDPPHWLQVMRDEGVTLWNSVPALLRLLLEAAQLRGVTLPSLRLVLLSGDKIPLDLPEQLRKVAPDATLVALGGATEVSIWSNSFPVAAVDPDWATIPYGYPLANQTWRVLDRHGFDCPTWVSGDLVIGGAGLAWGYWNDPARTALSFQPDDAGHGRLYRTGDIGRYLPGGCLEWMGRNDFQVKIQGHRIELGEIDAALLGHPQVAQAVVVAPMENGERRRLVAHVVPADGFTTDAAELESMLRQRLPHYMVPSAWCWWEQLPLSGNGKVDRLALDRASLEVSTTVVASSLPQPPQGPVEEQLLALWRRVLERSDFGVTDDFFELGGQSFDAIRIFSAVRDTLGPSYTLGQMWESRTVRGLARAIAGSGAGEQRTHADLVLINSAGAGAPLFLVHPAGGSTMGYVELGRALDCPVYGVQAGPPDRDGPLEIAGLAETYATALRKIRRGGPYRLGGWSSGAMIAFEMAARLEAAGDGPEQVLLLDGPVPNRRDDLTDCNLLLWFLQDLGIDLPLELVQTSQLRGLSPAEQLQQAAEATGLESRFGITPDSLLPSLLTFRGVVLAGAHYLPGVINSDLVVVRVDEDIVEEFAHHPSRLAPDWGWGTHTRGLVNCITVPGNHYTFLAQPNLKRWVSMICAPPDTALHG